MHIDVEETARARLRERLGAGARFDSPAAPARELAWARRGTAYFARKLNELTDDELDAPSLVPGWSRRHIVAQVGYNARALARLAEAARSGTTVETLAEPENQNEDLQLGATLPAHALRYLFKHSEVHLNVEWRDLSEAGWNATVQALDGLPVPIRRTPWLRAYEVWVRAVDLDNKASFLDFPPDLLVAMLEDSVAHWPQDPSRSSGLVLLPSEGRREIMVGGGGPCLAGSTADIVRWLCGRGMRRLTFDDMSRLPYRPLWP